MTQGTANAFVWLIVGILLAIVLVIMIVHAIQGTPMLG